MGINYYTIKLIDNQQPLYKLIYSLGFREQKMFKIYIKTNLANGFIRLYKFLRKVAIFYIKNSN